MEKEEARGLAKEAGKPSAIGSLTVAGKRIRGTELSVFPSFAADPLDAFHRQRGKKCLAEDSGRRGVESRGDRDGSGQGRRGKNPKRVASIRSTRP